MSERQLIENSFRHFKYNIQWCDTFADGNCLYRALALALLGNENKHRCIRFLVAYFLKHYKKHWSKVIFYPQETIIQMAKQQMYNNAWGDFVSIYVAAWLFNVYSIYI